MSGIDTILRYEPKDETERIAKKNILKFCDAHDNVFSRECLEGHMTSSGFVVNKEHNKVLMVYHTIYQSYSWTGGHNDGDEDWERVAKKEVLEETSLSSVKKIYELISIDDLPVPKHIKNGKRIKEHRHFNVTYVFEADELDEIHIKADENSAIKWIPFDEIDKWVEEEKMIPIYKKIIDQICKQGA